MCSTLTLATVKESDSGRYECTVDGIGTDLVTLEVVKGKPPFEILNIFLTLYVNIFVKII